MIQHRHFSFQIRAFIASFYLSSYSPDKVTGLYFLVIGTDSVWLADSVGLLIQFGLLILIGGFLFCLFSCPAGVEII